MVGMHIHRMRSCCLNAEILFTLCLVLFVVWGDNVKCHPCFTVHCIHRCIYELCAHTHTQLTFDHFVGSQLCDTSVERTATPRPLKLERRMRLRALCSEK